MGQVLSQNKKVIHSRQRCEVDAGREEVKEGKEERTAPPTPSSRPTAHTQWVCSDAVQRYGVNASSNFYQMKFHYPSIAMYWHRFTAIFHRRDGRYYNFSTIK
jgi:hypothetical protein